MNTSTAPLTLLYDGNCPVCALEMDHLRERVTDGRLVFVDIAETRFDPARYGVSMADLQAEIHAVRADGSVLKGVEVLRLAYEAAGLGWVLRPTAWAPLRPLFDTGYRLFARHRQVISRTLAPVIHGVRALRSRQRAHRMAQRMRDCHEGRCDIGDRPRPAARQPSAGGGSSAAIEPVTATAASTSGPARAPTPSGPLNADRASADRNAGAAAAGGDAPRRPASSTPAG